MKKEYTLKCKKCGNTCQVQGTKEDLEKWLDTMFGICPAGGNHVEIGNKRSYLEVVGESEQLSRVPTKKEILSKLLERIQQRKPTLIVGLDNPDIPNIHNFCPKKYRDSVAHCGFGFFEGKTEKGTFSFDGGGAMVHRSFKGGSLAWTPLRVENDAVLELIEYDFAKIERALQAEIQKCQ